MSEGQKYRKFKGIVEPILGKALLQASLFGKIL